MDVRPHEGLSHWITESPLGCTAVLLFLVWFWFGFRFGFYSLWLFGEFKFCTCLI